MKKIYPSKKLPSLLAICAFFHFALSQAQNDISLQWNVAVGCIEYDEEIQREPIPLEDISESTCILVCEDSIVNYKIEGSTSNISDIDWSVTGGEIMFTTSFGVQVKWNADISDGSLTFEIEFDNGTTLSKTQCVEVKPGPTANFNIPTNGGPPNLYCLDVPLNFINTSFVDNGEEIVSYEWDFGDGAFSTEFEPEHTYSQPVQYMVMLTVWDECGCSDSYKLPINFNQPAVEIICPTVLCEGAIDFYRLSNPSSCGAYSWDVDGGIIINGTQNAPIVDVKWNNIGDDGFGYLYFLQSACPGFCSGWTSVKIPVIQQNGTIQGKESLCAGEQYLYKLPQWPTTDFQWSLNGSGVTPDNIIITDQRNEIVVDTDGLTPGSYMLRCNYTNTLLGCGGTAEITLQISDPHIVNGPDMLCQYDSPTYTTQTPDASTTWLLTKGDDIVAQTTSTAFNYTFSVEGIYILTAVSDNFCESEPVIIEVFEIPETPTGTIDGEIEVCPGFPYEYSYTGTDNDPDTVLKWEVLSGNGSIQGGDIGETVTVVFDNVTPPTNYQVAVRLVHKDFQSCGSEPLIKPVEKLVIDTSIGLDFPIDGSPHNFCTSTEAGFSVDYLEGEVYEWSVYPDNFGSISGGQDTPNATVIWNKVSAGTTSGEVRLRIRKCGIFQQIVAYPVTLEETPVLTIVNLPGQICANEKFDVGVNSDIPINLGSSGPFTIDLEDGGGGSLNQTGPTTFVFEDVYFENTDTQNISKNIRVTLENVDGCDVESTVEAQVTVLPAPLIGITTLNGTVYCNPVNIDVWLEVNSQGGSTSGLSYEWYRDGNSIPDATGNTLHIDSTLGFGDYHVVATGNNGCSTISNIIEIIKNCDEPPCLADETIEITSMLWPSCNIMTVTGTYTGNPTSVTWRSIPDDGNINLISSTNNSATFEVLAPGNYTINYSLVYGTCYIAESKIGRIEYQPELVVEGECSSETGEYLMTLYNNSPFMPGFQPTANYYYKAGSGSWTAIPGNNDFATISLPPGSYAFKLEVYRSGRPVCTTESFVELGAFPDASFSIPSEICAEDLLHLEPDNIVPGHEYSWEYAGTGNELDVLDIMLAPGIHFIELNVKGDYGCTASFTRQITVNEADITGIITSNSPVCEGESITMSFDPSPDNIDAITAYQWMKDTSPIAGATNATYQPNSSGLYWVKLYNQDGCLENMEAVPITFLRDPYVEIEAPGGACVDEPFSLLGYSAASGVEYRWLREGVEIQSWSTVFPIELTATESATGNFTYTLEVRDTATGCTNSKNALIVVDQPGAISVSMQLQNCSPYRVELTATVGSDPGVYTWSNGGSGPVITVNKGGPYRAVFTPDAGCPVEAQIDVPKSPEEYIWIFPEGCFGYCPPGNWRKLIGPIPAFPNYLWHGNGSLPSQPGSGVVQDYGLSGNAGTLDLGLTNSLGCSVSSDMLNVFYEGSCGDCNLHYAITTMATLEMTPFYHYDLQGNIQNNLGFPITLTFISPQGHGTYVPSGISLSPGQIFSFPSSSSLEFVPSGSFTGGSSILLMQIELNGVVICTEEKTMQYPNLPGLLGETTLQLTPNPASGPVRATYDIAEENKPGQMSLSVHSLQGVVLWQKEIKSTEGEAIIPTTGWPSGSYVVVLSQNGMPFAQRVLIKK